MVIVVGSVVGGVGGVVVVRERKGVGLGRVKWVGIWCIACLFCRFVLRVWSVCLVCLSCSIIKTNIGF